MRNPTRAISVLAGSSVLALGVAGVGSAHPVHDGSGKEAGFDLVREDVSPGGVPQERMSNIRCEDGMAGIFPCHKVDLKSFMPLAEMDSVWVNDVWGWTDPQTGRDYALVSLYEGTGFVDITKADDPVWLGLLPSQNPGDQGNIWGDIKVNDDHAYIVSEAEGHGMQVFDLTRLRGVTSEQDWTADSHVADFGQAHNLAINEDSNMAYVVGAWEGIDVCDNGHGGPIAYDLSDPKAPEFAGCFGKDGYTHDIQCVEYHGPDVDYTGREICVASNEDTVTVLDLTDPANGKMLARAPYETASYTHQGWFTEDHGHFLLGDETDELEGTVDETTTYIWDLTDLDAPRLNGTASTGLKTIDHNIFIKDHVAYESNYTSGLRLFDTKKVADGRMREIGYFDGHPANDDTTFAGSWSNYPWFDDKQIFTSIEEGLYVVDSRAKSSATNNGR